MIGSPRRDCDEFVDAHFPIGLAGRVGPLAHLSANLGGNCLKRGAFVSICVVCVFHTWSGDGLHTWSGDGLHTWSGEGLHTWRGDGLHVRSRGWVSCAEQGWVLHMEWLQQLVDLGERHTWSSTCDKLYKLCFLQVRVSPNSDVLGLLSQGFDCC